MVDRTVARRRLAASFALAVGFGAYLVAGAALAVVHVNHVDGVVLLLIIAAVIGWWATVPGAILVALLGWPFYSGFVTHAYGQLGVTGPIDAVVAVLLLVFAVGASLTGSLPRRQSVK
jgi:hypothetical protein